MLYSASGTNIVGEAEHSAPLCKQDVLPIALGSIVIKPAVYEAIIPGEAASKANSRKIVLFGKRPAVIKSDKARAYCSAFRAVAPRLDPLLTGDLFIALRIVYKSRRPDLDESLILDLLQGVAYENDRQIKGKHVTWGLDPDHPRCEIAIYAMSTNHPPRTARSRIRYEKGAA